MPKLIWDNVNEKIYETGVDHGVLYPAGTGVNAGTYPEGVVWNGLTAINESPEGAESNAQYADNIKYVNLISAENFKGTIEAFMYPDEFAECDGSAEVSDGVFIGQQARKPFGLSYRTVIGNDSQGENYGSKIHIIYGAQASPSEKAYSTINDSPEAITFSWEFDTTPVPVEGHKPSATMTIDSTKVTPAKFKSLEAILYGVDDFSAAKTYAVGDYVMHETTAYVCKTAITTPAAWNASDWDAATITVGPRLPLPAEIIALFEA